VTLSFAEISGIILKAEAAIIEPFGFVESFLENNLMFEVGQQEDASEFIAFLLDRIHEDLNRILTDTEQETLKKEYEKPDSDATELSEIEHKSKVTWKNYL